MRPVETWNMMWLLTVFAPLVCGGCGGSGSDSSSNAVAVDASVATLTYPNGHPLSLPTSDGAALSNEDQIVQLVNDHRVSIGLNALVAMAALADAARAHSDHMIVHDFFAHTNPEGDAPADRITKVGIAWIMAGENIAGGYSAPTAAFDAWLASPGHLANIERAGWTHTGVGYDADPASTYTWYWTQDFIEQ